MPGATFLPGQTMVRPGVYVNVQSQGQNTPLAAGVVAAIFKASWGPLNVVTPLFTLDSVANAFWTSGTVDTAQEAFRGGAQKVLAIRAGSGGAAASVILKDTAGTPANIVTVTALYPGVRGNNLSISVANALSGSGRTLSVYEGTTLRQQINYTVTNMDEAQSIVTAVLASNSQWITAAKIATGTGVAANVTQSPLVTGTDPTVATGDYSNALALLTTQQFNVLVADTETNAQQVTIQAWVDQQRGLGQRVTTVVGEPTSVAIATRESDAAGFNDPAVVYVANGFTRLAQDGVTPITVQGHAAAARVAGMIAGTSITTSLTHYQIPDATGLVGALADSDIQVCIQSGALVFSLSASGLVQIEYGITTLVNPPATLDAGWKKIRRVKTRDYLIGQIAANWDALVGRVNNNPDGQNILIHNAQGVINTLIAQGALLSGSCALDPANPPSGDAAWFKIMVDDVDSAEHIYLTVGLEFSAQPNPTA